MRKLTACALQRKGIHQQEMVGQFLIANWGSNPQPSTRVNEQYVEQKLNELWKMRLSK